MTATASTMENGKAATQLAPKANNAGGDVTYNVAGQEVHLNYNIVRNFLTKGGGNVSDADLVQFISICKFNQLNPFLNEAYLVKYGNSPATMIVSKEALMKRAEACPGYEGFEAGIIVKHGDDIKDVQGCFIVPGDELLGGWAIVHRSDKRYPTVARVGLGEYSTGQSLWKGKPSTMIRKVAIVQALREAFPAQLGAMYTQEEQEVIDGNAVEVKEEIARNANQQVISFADNAPQPAAEPAPATVDTETGEIIDGGEAAQAAAAPAY